MLLPFFSSRFSRSLLRTAKLKKNRSHHIFYGTNPNNDHGTELPTDANSLEK
jgi:hypothetical protein